VITLALDAEALGRVRLSISPVMEAVTWLQLATTGRQHPVFGDPGAATRAALRHPDVTLVADLIPPANVRVNYVPDLLTPKPQAGSWKDILDAQITQIESTGEGDVHTQVCHLTETYWGNPSPRRIRRLAEAGQLQRRLAAGVAHFWKETLDDDWQSLQAVLDTDITQRAKVIAAHGIGPLLDALHPMVAWTGGHVTIEWPYDITVDLTGQDLVLAASVLTWPNLVCQVDDRAQATLYYPANRVGNSTVHRGPDSLVEIIGAARTALLIDLDAPRSTTELAIRHGLSASTVSYHLGTLHRAKLVAKHRVGRRVLYQRTERANTLTTPT
jgi:DNA-binding transcriptional ArsR family regulator